MTTIGADHGGKSSTYTHDPLTRADGKPDPLFCFGFKQEIYANIATVPHPTLGEGGWLGMVMPADQYHAYNGVHWTEPTAAHPPTLSYSGQLADTGLYSLQHNRYLEQQKLFMLYRNICADIRRLMLDAIDEEYLADIPIPAAKQFMGTAALSGFYVEFYGGISQQYRQNFSNGQKQDAGDHLYKCESRCLERAYTLIQKCRSNGYMFEWWLENAGPIRLQPWENMTIQRIQDPRKPMKCQPML